jgi:small-conductance mechanosensitive channel
MNLEIFGAREVPAGVVAASVTLLALVALLLVRRITLGVARRAAASQPPTSLRAIPLRLAMHARFGVAVVVALFAGSLVLDLPAEAHAVARAVLVLTVLLQLALWGSDLIAFWADRYQARAAEGASGAAGTAFALRFMASLALWVVLVLLALENVGLEITTLVAGLGIGGIAIALAAQSVLGDFFASLAIVLDRPFVVGDLIAVDGLRGTVERVGVKTTRVRSIDGEQLVFANADLVRSRVRNFGRLQERRVAAKFRLAPGTSADAVEFAVGIVRNAVAAQSGVRLDRAHFIGITIGIPEIEAVYFVLSPAFDVHMDIQQAVQLEVMRGFAEAGIGLAGVPGGAADASVAESARLSGD